MGRHCSPPYPAVWSSRTHAGWLWGLRHPDALKTVPIPTSSSKAEVWPGPGTATAATVVTLGPGPGPAAEAAGVPGPGPASVVGPGPRARSDDRSSGRGRRPRQWVRAQGPLRPLRRDHLRRLPLRLGLVTRSPPGSVPMPSGSAQVRVLRTQVEVKLLRVWPGWAIKQVKLNINQGHKFQMRRVELK